MASGANNSRLTSITYPNGYVLDYNYASGVDSNISRITSLSDSTGTLQTYAYLGLDTPVIMDDTQPGIELTYVKQSGESNGDAGDQYIGLDRFGRVVDQRWINTSTSTATDRFQYGYDQDGNVLYKNNLVNSSFSELYHANGASNGYDNLNQLVAFARGTLSDTNSDGIPDTVASPSTTNSWSMDALGNFTSIGSTSETNNKQNEVTAYGSASLAYDANGNLTTDQNGDTLIYNAWNELVAYKNGSTTLETLAYDGLGRRIIENPGTATDLYYSNQWQVLEEQVSGAAKINYVWSPVYVDAMVLRDRDATGSGTLSERLWVQQDANWNVTALVNTSGSVVERYVYDPYGVRTVLTASWGSTSGSAYAWIYGHQGGRLDTTTGLYGFRNRDLSPVLGRWIEVDPLGFTGGQTSFYQYVGNDPANLIDPMGLQGFRQSKMTDQWTFWEAYEENAWDDLSDKERNKINNLIDRLNSDEYEVRERTQKELQELLQLYYKERSRKGHGLIYALRNRRMEIQNKWGMQADRGGFLEQQRRIERLLDYHGLHQWKLVEVNKAETGGVFGPAK